MMTAQLTRRRTRQKGVALVEFTFVALTFFLVLFGIIEMERMLLVYSSVTNAARGAVRYAQVHGSDRTGGGVNGPSSTANHTNVVNTAKALVGGSTIDPANLTVTVTYPDSTGNAPGSRVQVTVSYPYDPFTFVPGLNVTLGARSEGVITF